MEFQDVLVDSHVAAGFLAGRYQGADSGKISRDMCDGLVSQPYTTEQTAHGAFSTWDCPHSRVPQSNRLIHLFRLHACIEHQKGHLRLCEDNDTNIHALRSACFIKILLRR